MFYGWPVVTVGFVVLPVLLLITVGAVVLTVCAVIVAVKTNPPPPRPRPGGGRRSRQGPQFSTSRPEGLARASA